MSNPGGGGKRGRNGAGNRGQNNNPRGGGHARDNARGGYFRGNAGGGQPPFVGHQQNQDTYIQDAFLQPNYNGGREAQMQESNLRGGGRSRGNAGARQGQAAFVENQRNQFPSRLSQGSFPSPSGAFGQDGNNGRQRDRTGGDQRMPTNNFQNRDPVVGSWRENNDNNGGRRGNGSRGYAGNGHDGNGGGRGTWRNSRDQVRPEQNGSHDNSGRDEEERVVEQRSAKKIERYGPVFGFKRLYYCLSQSTDEILMSINKDKEDWKAILEDDKLTDEMLVVAIQILGEKICVDVSVLHQLQTNILSACCSEPFVTQLTRAVPKIANKTLKRMPYQKFPVDCDPVKALQNIYQFCLSVSKVMPDIALENYFMMLITMCLGASNQCDKTGSLYKMFNDLSEQLGEASQRKVKKEETVVRRKKYGFNAEDEAEMDAATPPNDIKDIAIIPSVVELRSGNDTVFLRPNKQTGSYKDSKHYLDVQFRLLREDFGRPLRKGIDILLNDKQKYLARLKRMPLGEVRLYPEVSFLKVEKERDTIVHKLQLDEEDYKRVKWDKSKRLLPGSLVLLTTHENCFQQNNTYFGVVFNRNPKELEKGVLTVTWEGSPPVYDDNQEYFMLESEVYLEAYRYTLETLKNLDLDQFPMKKFIVDANRSVEAPNYLRNATKLLQVKLASGEDRYIAPLQADNWPTAKEFGLDNNQLEAFRAALTNEFTIIQGPPGTGKTFLALKVAEVLLKNSELWEDPGGNPITVVCYTNHALDQFLEGILGFYQKEDIPPEIIRIGGRCKSEVLSGYSLKEVRSRNGRKIPHHCYDAVRQARDKIRDLESDRSNGMNEVIGLQDVQGIVDFERLSTWAVIRPEYPESFWNQLRNLEWLGIGDNQLKQDRFFEWFTVRPFAKNQKNKVKQRQSLAAVERINLEEEYEDDEDYDVDELLDNRVLDDIFLEAETAAQNVNVGRCLCYLPDCSIYSCERRIKQINKSRQNTTRDMNMAHTVKARDSNQGEVRVVENRRKFLNEICSLYKERRLDLPDVTDSLIEIRAEAEPYYYDGMYMAKRWALYFSVVEWARRKVAERVADIEKSLGEQQRVLRNLNQYGDGMVLRGCKVVGLTTTGAAKYNNLLKMIKSKIVIVEEAAEVFESHIVACITESCEQLILIGDHRQLRPSPTVYELATKYRLDLSLFERMLNNNLHCYPLKMQHRMRPDIADLLVGRRTDGFIYDELLNHESVKMYPDVKGMTKNVYFITHTEKESSEKDSMSKSNIHEAKFIAGLCRYLIQQGYRSDDITVLTMYIGQMFLLKKEVGPFCKDVRITCVDNFQGEENKIILLSLVRSNQDGKIGFLGIENRICVSLSRAKHGLYVIGDMTSMMKNKTWEMIKQKLDNQEGIGPELELECQNHGTRTKVKTGREFLLNAPQGGCLQLCYTTLACTHKCAEVCHVRDKNHEEYKCRLPCLKQCANSWHPCKGKCSDQCPPCGVRVVKTLNCELYHQQLLPCHKKVEQVTCFEIVNKKLACSHEKELACHVSIHEFACKEKVLKKLACGHKRTMECHVDPTGYRCKEIVPKGLSCGHTQNAECWLDKENIKCEAIVPKKFDKCGHKTTVECVESAKPISCKAKCTRRPPCGHACLKNCHVEDDPDHVTYECKKPCGRSCPDDHKCVASHQCFKQPCPPCKAKVIRNLPCGHQKELECCVDIEAYKCMEPCEQILPGRLCLHKCPNLCFQECGPCLTKVKKRANCGHGQMVLCSEAAVKENCEEPVPPKNLPICGHRDSLVPCKYDNLGAEKVVKFCQHPCGYKFRPAAGGGCDHQCSGNCSSCLQGRIHMKCSSNCGKQLVCGHRCQVPCSKVCPPCQKPCLMKCEHSECSQTCGQPCSECKEKCTWRCPHKECSKLCGELCDREACNEPCPKKLKCGHECVGFCGEPCPPLCRICDWDELTSFFLIGNEQDEDARFVYLEDCGHTIEVEGLEGSLRTSSSDGQISAKGCPRCTTTIRNCRRFGNLIRQHYRNVIKVKMLAFGNRAKSDRMRNGWITKLNDNPPMERIFPQVYLRIRDFLFTEVRRHDGTGRRVGKTIDEFSMRSLDFIADSVDKAASGIQDLERSENLKSRHYAEVVSLYRNTFGWMLDRQPLSRQELIDFDKELDRLDFIKQLMIRRSLAACNPGNTRAYRCYRLAKGIVASTLPFTEDRKNRFKAGLKELDDLLRSGLGITDRERREIVEAMGMAQGHWYSCPNGHIYAIGDCGGAMEESLCNVCGARIGGTSHQLTEGNQLAREMDGASGPAWPTMLQR